LTECKRGTKVQLSICKPLFRCKDPESRSFCCVFCRTTARPIVKHKVSVGGWLVFLFLASMVAISLLALTIAALPPLR
jgi:hypothetical protein